MTLDTERIDRLEGISDKLTNAVLTIYEKLDRMEKRLENLESAVLSIASDVALIKAHIIPPGPGEHLHTICLTQNPPAPKAARTPSATCN